MKDSTIGHVDRLRKGFASLRGLIVECNELAKGEWAESLRLRGKGDTADMFVPGAMLFKTSLDALMTAERACMVEIIEQGEGEA